MQEKRRGRHARRRRAPIAALALVLVGVTAAGAAAPPLEGVFRDNFSLLAEPTPAPGAAFQRLDGGETTLADYRGRVVLLNFWATWCAPCRREMPSLDRLAGALAGEPFVVLAVSEDRGGPEKVRAFVEELGLERMEIARDPKGGLASALGVTGLPATFLVDARGRVVGSLEGPAEWDAEPAQALVRHYLAQAKELPPPAEPGLWQRLGAWWRALWPGE